MRPDVPNINLSRRGKIVIGVVVSLFVILSLLGSLANTYTQWLWFGEVHFRNVFSTILWTRVILFLSFGFVMALVIALNMWLAYRMRPPFRPISQEQENLERYRVALEPQKKWIFAGIVGVSWFAAGMAAQQSWRTWQLFRYGGPFGVKDPQFHRDISFFAWDYPTYRLILGFGFNAVIFSLLLSLGVHYLFGALRIATPGPKLTISARRHVTVLVFVFIVLKAMSYWLDRYGLVFSTRGRVSGASYTDVNASLPAKTILFWAAVLISLAVLASLWLKSAQIAGISFAVLLILSIGINGIYPALVQSITVKPNAIDKEAPYILRNIEATRAAYEISNAADPQPGKVTYVPYETQTAAPASSLLKDSATIGNIRLTDPSVVPPVFANLQALRSYYGFPGKLDIDRYKVNGVVSDYIVGVRELDAANLSPQAGQTSWISKHTVLTHGYGLVAVKADREVINDARNFDVGNIPVQGFVKLDRPEVYYGELGVDYSIVGAPGARELNGNDDHSTYDGKGGVRLSFLNRLAFAVKYRQTNFLLNDAVSATGSKIIFDRDPRLRIQKVAPFLQVDSDPFPTVVNGRIVWMLDGYTTMANYPYSERRSFGTLTTDSLSGTKQLAGQPNSQINYIRNSVKATVDAYDGTVHLYAWDESDPVLKAWRKVFPNVVEPKTAIPAEVLDHIRYPTDMFEVQRGLLEKYHVSDPHTFFQGTDQWTVPNDPTTGGTADQPPYYVLAGPSGGTDGSAAYQLTSAMKANNRNVMAAYISANSQAGPDYGKFTVLTMPSDTSIQGPEQVFNTFNTQDVISKDITLLSGSGSSVVHGNLLSLPIGNTFLYVEPLYVQGSQGSQAYPRLQRVLVAYGQRIGYGCTLASALRNLDQSVVGQEIGSAECTAATSTGGGGGGTTTPTSTPSGTTTATPTTSASPGSTDVTSILSQLDAAFADLQAAYRSGDFAKIGAAQQKVQQLTQQYLRARSSAPGASSPAKSSSASASATPSASPSR